LKASGSDTAVIGGKQRLDWPSFGHIEFPNPSQKTENSPRSKHLILMIRYRQMKALTMPVNSNIMYSCAFLTTICSAVQYINNRLTEEVHCKF